MLPVDALPVVALRAVAVAAELQVAVSGLVATSLNEKHVIIISFYHII